MKNQIIISFIMLVLGVAGVTTTNNQAVSIFLIICSLLSFLSISIDKIKSK